VCALAFTLIKLMQTLLLVFLLALELNARKILAMHLPRRLHRQNP